VNKVLITGAGGQLGTELRRTVPSGCKVIACTAKDLDITDRDLVGQIMERIRPTLVINAAAYTRVDDAESEPDRAHAVNAQGAANVAEMAHRIGARMIQISTDFVFDGSLGRPYTPDDEPEPLGVYGQSKLEGERLVQERTGSAALIVRTAWVYAAQGHNFVGSMLRLMRQRESIGVVSDQVGTPTWARGLAEALWAARGLPDVRGTVHWTDAGVASWYDFAVAIQEEALALGLLAHAIPIIPLRTDQFPRPAPRPGYSVLDKTSGWTVLGSKPTHWRVNLRRMLQGLALA